MATLEESRRAIGQRIRDDLERSLRPARQDKALPALPNKGALPVRVGVGEWPAAGRGSSGGGGIASPLSEASAATREYWPGGLPSSDGLFILPALKVLNLTDASGAAVKIQLADPGAA